MFLANVVNSGEKIGIGEAAITALLGYVVVFFGLILLMIVVIILGKILVASRSKAAAKTAAAAPAAPVAAPAPVKTAAPAPGTAGEVKLFNVGDREAAMLMAIVANKLGKPLNELRFKSIKEV